MSAIDWNKLKVQDLINLSKAASDTCAFELTSCTGYSGRIEVV